MIRPPDPPRDDRRRAAAAAAEQLSPRLKEVLHGLLAGESEKQVSSRLRLSPHTVHQYVKILYRTFGVQSRGELAALLMAPVAEPPKPAAPAHASSGLLRRYTAPLTPPAADAPEAEHVVYCVKLLENRGFVVRYIEATRSFVRRRRGVVLSSVLVLIICAVVGVRNLDLPRERIRPDERATYDFSCGAERRSRRSAMSASPPGQPGVAGGGGGAGGAGTLPPDPGCGTSSAPVRYFDGLAIIGTNDVTTDASGQNWGHTRTWRGGTSVSHNGNGWFVMDLPRVEWNSLTHTVDNFTEEVISAEGVIQAVDSGGNRRYFDYDYDGTTVTITARDYSTNKITQETGAGGDELVLRDESGGETRYNMLDFPTTAGESATSGRFLKYTSPGGTLVETTWSTTSGQEGEILQVDVKNPANAHLERFVYSYTTVTNTSTSKSVRRLSSVEHKVSDGSSGYTTERSVTYSYYTGQESGGHGRLGEMWPSGYHAARPPVGGEAHDPVRVMLDVKSAPIQRAHASPGRRSAR